MSFTPECPACGYSLVDLPDGRCPECGEGFSHAALLARHQDRLRQGSQSMLTGLSLLGWFVLSCVFLGAIISYQSVPMASVTAFACLLAMSAWMLRSDIRSGRKSIALCLLIAVAFVLLFLGVAITATSVPLYGNGYRWTSWDIPTVRGWRPLTAATGCVLGPSIIAIALGIWAGLWRLTRGRPGPT